LIDPLGRRGVAFVPIADHPRALAFSPSGHRIYVALRGGLGLAVIDRYAHEELDGVALPSAAATIRIDPLGRWLPARPPGGDSVGPEGPLYVQVSVSQNQDWSQRLAQELGRAGLPAKVLAPATTDEGYRVVLGPYPTREVAEGIGRKLGRPYWIYQPQPQP